MWLSLHSSLRDRNDESVYLIGIAVRSVISWRHLELWLSLEVFFPLNFSCSSVFVFAIVIGITNYCVFWFCRISLDWYLLIWPHMNLCHRLQWLDVNSVHGWLTSLETCKVNVNHLYYVFVGVAVVTALVGNLSNDDGYENAPKQ